MKHVIYFIGVVSWIAGIVIAKGFWSSLIAFIIPFWAWYLLVETVLMRFGII